MRGRVQEIGLKLRESGTRLWVVTVGPWRSPERGGLPASAFSSSLASMAKCFVIQPFDRDKFDRRYEETFKPAIEAARYEPYRVDKDPSVEIPIEQIEKGIRARPLPCETRTMRWNISAKPGE